MRRRNRYLDWCWANPGKLVGAGLALLAVLAVSFVDVLLAEPLRVRAVRMMNANLDGYTVHITRVHPHVWRLGMDLDHLDLVQNAHPDPPVANVDALSFSLRWWDLIHFKLAGDLAIRRPALHIDLTQIKEEGHSQVRLQDRGWQRAVESVYPIKLDRVDVQDGSLLYLSGRTADKPLQFTQVAMVATHIRNVAVAKGTFPSPVTLEGVLFDTGKVRFKGEADFLREPQCAIRGVIHLDRVPLDRLAPLAQDYQLKTTGGFLSTDGTMEYTPEASVAHLTQVRVEGLRLDYITSRATRAVEEEHAREAVKLAQRMRNAPKLRLQVDTLTMVHGEVGFVDRAATPAYRLFLADADLKLDNLSNQTQFGRSRFQARGSFMGHGSTTVSGSFQPAADPADFTVRLRMDDARLPDLNDCLLAQWGVDVADGLVSVYAELTVKNRHLDGYLKPMLKNVKIYDRRKDSAKPFGKRVELHLLQALAGVFKNHSTQDVATVIPLSGATSQPRAGQWEAVRKLIGNGLWRAILPGFLDRRRADK
ncbi:MAG: DUF748 domain-containing protein [Holophaga sp.]|nr:DUF748 domain-containing protein [Holophaga sp.]